MADTACCDHSRKSVVDMFRLTLPGAVLRLGSLSEEHANAAPLIISLNQSIVLLRLKCKAWLHAFPDEAVKLGNTRSNTA